jgi:hypothetical protein
MILEKKTLNKQRTIYTIVLGITQYTKLIIR